MKSFNIIAYLNILINNLKYIESNVFHIKILKSRKTYQAFILYTITIEEDFRKEVIFDKNEKKRNIKKYILQYDGL